MNDDLWYWTDGKTRHGPFDKTRMQGLASRGTLAPETLIWHSGLSDWEPAAGHLSFAAETVGGIGTPPPPPPDAAVDFDPGEPVAQDAVALEEPRTGPWARRRRPPDQEAPRPVAARAQADPAIRSEPDPAPRDAAAGDPWGKFRGGEGRSIADPAPRGGATPRAAPRPGASRDPALDPSLAPKSVGPVGAFARALGGLLKFRGRASRSEYWWVFLGFWIINSAVFRPWSLFDMDRIGDIDALGGLVFWAVASIAVILPLSVRRLHDAGFPGVMVLVTLIPGIGPLILLFLMSRRSDPDDNDYGPRSDTI